MRCSSARLDELFDEQLNEQLEEQLDERLKEQLNELLNEHSEEQLDELLKEPLKGHLKDEGVLQKMKVFSRGKCELIWNSSTPDARPRYAEGAYS